MPLTSGKKLKRDVALIGKPVGNLAPIVRFKEYENGKVEVEDGVLVPIKNGETTLGEIVTLAPEKGHAPFVKIDVIAESPVKSHPGPANVATEAYRQGWERTFKGKINPDESQN